MFKNIHVKLINVAVENDFSFLDERKYLVEYDHDFVSTFDLARPLLDAIGIICIDFNIHKFACATVTDAETGEVLAELERVDEEM